MKLALTLEKHELEPLSSYVSRLSHHNGVGYVQDFFEDVGINLKKLLRLEVKTLEAFSALSGVAVEQLTLNSTRVVSTSEAIVNGMSVSRNFLDTGVQKFCSKCIARCGYGHFIWIIDSIWVCPEHKTLLQVLQKPKYPRLNIDFIGHLNDTRLISESDTHVIECSFTATIQMAIQNQQGHLYGFPLDIYAKLCR